MLHVVEAPVLKLAAVAGAALMLGAFVAPEKHTGTTVQRLVLHAPELPNATYHSAWRQGDVTVTLRDGTPRPITFETRGLYIDGCYWLGTEKLYPTGENRYSYSYDETLLGCTPEGTAEFTIKTPRTGYVVAFPAD